MKRVYPYGTFNIKNLNNRNVFKVNGHHLKAYFDNFPNKNEFIDLNNFFLQRLNVFSHIVFVWLFFFFASLFPTPVKW
jgi:hypothetical protein